MSLPVPVFAVLLMQMECERGQNGNVVAIFKAEKNV